jgi:hypothetical protein
VHANPSTADAGTQLSVAPPPTKDPGTLFLNALGSVRANAGFSVDPPESMRRLSRSIATSRFPCDRRKWRGVARTKLRHASAPCRGASLAFWLTRDVLQRIAGNSHVARQEVLTRSLATAVQDAVQVVS